MTEEILRSSLTLFENKEADNTLACFESVADRVKELGLEHVVVASTSGETGAKAVEYFEDYGVELVVITHQYGFKRDGKIELEDEHRKVIEEANSANLIATPDVLTRVPKIVRGKYGGASYLDLIADTLRIFSEGVKVCVECTVQAADSGNIPVGKEIAAIAGTGHGADTGVILVGQHSHKMLDIDIREIVCMPRKR